MKIWTLDERKKECLRGNHMFYFYEERIGYIEQCKMVSKWWSYYEIPKVSFIPITDKRAACSICYKQFTVDYKMKEIK